MERHANAAHARPSVAGRVARVLRLAAVVPAAWALLALPAIAGDAATSSRVPQPALATPSGEPCIEDPAFMRRNHPDLLKHQRVQTVHEGIRTPRASLANCVSCHASRQTGRVTGSADAFCESCHRYASVKLDCFECHSDRPKAAAVTNVAGATRP